MVDPRHRWKDLGAAFGAAPAVVSALWTEIAGAYGARGRHYHTLQHIEVLLALSERHRVTIVDRTVFDLAILLHDVIYEARRSDNEMASAAWARDQLPPLGVGAVEVNTVAHFIEMSRHRPEDFAAIDPASDLALFLDFDLSVLATSPDDYEIYAKAIRDEYSIFPDLLYKPGRARVLRTFLQRPFIYCSPPACAAWESSARRNIAHEISNLTGA
jgi:predicted metal-dependent HD superfamily phosphohydrolase